jgi:GcrA cell cycle regulator
MAPLPAPPQPAPTPRPVVATAPRSGGCRLQPCCWPLGDPGTRSFRFCDAESLAGKPYCDQHAQLAYVRVRDRRDEAA